MSNVKKLEAKILESKAALLSGLILNFPFETVEEEFLREEKEMKEHYDSDVKESWEYMHPIPTEGHEYVILSDQEEQNEKKLRRENIVLRLFMILKNQVLVYIESQNLINYGLYAKELLEQYSSSSKVTTKINDDYSIFHYQGYEVIQVIDSLLSPFDFMDNDSIENLAKANGIKYLENILQQTGAILENIKINPNSEPRVYNAVKFVIKSIFPSSIHPTKRFFTSFRNFEPDILIPQLEVAIEYKYAKDEATLKSTIEQIAPDAIGYAYDENYKLFYGVFYVTGEAKKMGQKRFEQAIIDMKYPKNWKFYYIEG